MKSTLQPELRTDRNGRTQRRWVRPDRGASAAAAIPSPKAPSEVVDETPLERLVFEGFGGEAVDVLRWVARMDETVAEAYGDIAQTLEGQEDGAAAFRGVAVHGGLTDTGVFVMRECADLLPDIDRCVPHTHEPRPYHRAVEAVMDQTNVLYARYQPTSERIRQDAPLLRAALIAGLLDLTRDLASPFEEHAQYVAVSEHFEELRAHLPSLVAMGNALRGARIRGDVGLYVEICEAAGDRDAVFAAIGDMAVERGRLDRDDALAVARGGAPALASGLL